MYATWHTSTPTHACVLCVGTVDSDVLAFGDHLDIQAACEVFDVCVWLYSELDEGRHVLKFYDGAKREVPAYTTGIRPCIHAYARACTYILARTGIYTRICAYIRACVYRHMYTSMCERDRV